MGSRFVLGQVFALGSSAALPYGALGSSEIGAAPWCDGTVEGECCCLCMKVMAESQAVGGPLLVGMSEVSVYAGELLEDEDAEVSSSRSKGAAAKMSCGRLRERPDLCWLRWRLCRARASWTSFTPRIDSSSNNSHCLPGLVTPSWLSYKRQFTFLRLLLHVLDRPVYFWLAVVNSRAGRGGRGIT